MIVGAGPAGTFLALELSRRTGVRTAVLEARWWDDLWGKPCGDAIGAHHFELRGLHPPPGTVKQEVRAVEIYSPREDAVLRAHGKGFIIDRRRMGQALLEEAVRRGVELYMRSHAREILVEGGRVVGVRALLEGREAELRARVVVEATGFASPLRRRLPQDLPIAELADPKDTDIAFREVLVLEDELERPDVIRIYLNQAVAPGGYWWLFPEGRDQANVGLGVQGGMGHPDPRELYRKRIATRRELSRVAKVLSSGGAVVPTRRPIDTLVWNGFAVVGDAAYNANPLHGGGMGYAMEAASCVATAISEALERGDTSERGLWGANLCYHRSVGAKQAALEMVRVFLQGMSDEELQFIMEKRLVADEDVDVLSRRAELREGLLQVVQGAFADITRALRGLRKPSLLLKLRRLSEFVEEAKEAYRAYPEAPEELPRWRASVRALFERFKGEMGLGA